MCLGIFIKSAEERQVGFMSFGKEASLNPILRGALGSGEGCMEQSSARLGFSPT